MKYSDFICVNEGFQTSVNLEYDLNIPAKVKGYIPTEQSVRVLGEFLKSFYYSNDTQSRANVLVGPYGRGKSHLLLVLSAITSLDMFATSEDERKQSFAILEELCDKIYSVNEEVGALAREIIQSGIRTLPVIINSNFNDINQSFLLAINDALAKANLQHLLPATYFDSAISIIKKWETNFPEAYKKLVQELKKKKIKVEDLLVGLCRFDQEAYSAFCDCYPQIAAGTAFNPMTNMDVVKLYQSVVDALVEQTEYSGINIIFDEFSKFLESNMDKSKMLNFKIIQDVAELASRSGKKQIHFTCITHKESDKNTIRKFLITGMVKKIFSSSVESGLSNILGKLKQTNLNGDIELRCSDHFDFDSLKTLEFQERTLRVEEADVDEIINFKKGPLTFMILSLLYPDLKLSEIKWHQDHIHPRYAFDKNRLIKYFAEKGMKLDDNTLKAWAANSNTLVNLQLLTGKQNQEKSKTPLVTWIYNQFPDDDKRKKYCEEHYIDFDAGFELENFDAYYNRRREKLKKKLMEIFSVQVISEEETRIIEEQTSEEESVITPEGKTIAEAAVSVLIDHPEGLTCKQIYEAIMEQHLYEFKAEKPEVVLRIEIRRRCQNVDISKSYETKWFRIVKKVDGECYYGITFSD